MLKVIAACFFMLSFFAVPANAVVVVHLWEEAGNVEARATGTLNRNGITFLRNSPFPDGFRVEPGGREVLFFGAGDLYRVPNSAPSFGSGGITVEPFESEGDHFGWENHALLLPTGFTSGGSIFSTGRILSTTLADLGAVAGVYDWILPQDRIRLVVNSSPISVPLPASLPLLLAGLGLFGFVRAGASSSRR